MEHTNEQDKKVGFGIIGAMAGGGVVGTAVLAADALGVVLGSLSVANGVDDALSNSKQLKYYI